MNGHPCGGCPCGTHYPGGNTPASFPSPFGDQGKQIGKNTAIQVAPDQTLILLHPPLPLVGVPIGTERGCQRNDSLVNGCIQDLVRIPKVPPGEYVVGFRWDCETSSQVWTSCADIRIE